jgi:hypothetical protein
MMVGNGKIVDAVNAVILSGNFIAAPKDSFLVVYQVKGFWWLEPGAVMILCPQVFENLHRSRVKELVAGTTLMIETC